MSFCHFSISAAIADFRLPEPARQCGMLPGRHVFAELMDHVSRFEFQKCVAHYDGNYKSSRFSCWDQYVCMAFAQLTYRESARHRSVPARRATKLYHLGIRARVARSTLADSYRYGGRRNWCLSP